MKKSNAGSTDISRMSYFTYKSNFRTYQIRRVNVIIKKTNVRLISPKVAMPVSFQQIREQIHKKGPAAVRRQAVLEERTNKAYELLLQYASEPGTLRALVEAAQARNPDLRCAVPGDQPLTQTFPVLIDDCPSVILAADGSQINPDRHNQVEFGVINTGAVRFEPGLPPREIVESKLLLGDELQLESGPLTEEFVALLRDLNERTLLADAAEKERLPVVTLTDGQLELFHRGEETRAYDERFAEYLDALRRLCKIEAVTAGYVDRPKGDLVVRLLELTMVSRAELEKVHVLRPLRWALDARLFERILDPGERSAVFKIHSKYSGKFPGELALHFFYINVGDRRRCHLARVEIPAWVAGNEQLICRLHAALIAQSQPLGNRPYPYAIHRAHEVAVVHQEEKQQINDLIAQEYRRLGLDPGDRSNKQIAKDNSGKRTRYP